MQIIIPYGYTPRDYQTNLWRKVVHENCKRAIYIWHRRAGKDLFGLNVIIKEAIFGQIGTYWHVFPTYNQGKKAIWNETDVNGRPYLDYFPKELIASKNDQEMRLKLVNGSIYQIVGSDNPDSLRGAGIKGAIFSEYAEQTPGAWETIQPMLLATNGFALFNFTPKGQNHAYFLYEMAKHNPNWYTEILTVEDTKGQVFSEEQITNLKNEILGQGKTLEFFEQEYLCSFSNPIEGSYYSKLIKQAEEDGRISNVPYDPSLPVSTWWDLGVSDTTAIWFTQAIGKEVRVIDYEEHNGKGLHEYIKLIKEKPYVYESHNAPHDIRVREYTNGKARVDTARELGINFSIVPNIPRQDGINAVRSILPRCWFNADKCRKGLMALKNYKRKFDERKNRFHEEPFHDWASNGADSFRYFAVGYYEKVEIGKQFNFYEQKFNNNQLYY